MENTNKANFAGGCFWCMVKPFGSIDGVIEVISGYTGGSVVNTTYEQVTEGFTGHLEAVQITYDEDIANYRELVEIFFMSIDPTDAVGNFMIEEKVIKQLCFIIMKIRKILQKNILMN